ncbi:MAG: DUF5906 domain-containing protein [Thermoanaerobaculia bacterium]
MLGEGLGGVDLDSCRNPDTGAIAPWAQELLDRFGTYAEVSPSGTGVKLYALGAPAELPASVIPMDAAPINGKRAAAECYVNARYFAFTGRRLDGCPAEIRDSRAAWNLVVKDLRERANRNGQRETRRSTEPAEIPLRRVLDGKAGRIWREGAGDGADRSRNDAALAATLGAKGFADAEIEAALRAYPLGQIGQGVLTGRDADRQIGRLLGIAAETRSAREEGKTPDPGGDLAVSARDFYAYMPMHMYIYRPTRELWPASSVNARAAEVDGMKPAPWIDQNRPVDQMTWAPGLPLLVPNRLIAEGGWIDHAGARVFNRYRPPKIEPGDASKAGPWLDHVRRVYPNDASHITTWLAQRVQQPGVKVNHALVLGGAQGIGKDTILEPIRHAVGPWNVEDVSPVQLMGRFNGFLKSVILRISEARDLGGLNRFNFYDHTKAYTAAPPEVLRIDENNIREYAIPNVCGVVITTNHKTDGIYLPADDRRHYVAWSTTSRDEFDAEYWDTLYGWYESGGRRHVAAYLREFDLSEFNPKAPPPATPAFLDIVDANRAPEDAELADALDALANPDVTTLAEVASKAVPSFAEWLTDRRNNRQVPHRMESSGYVAVRNSANKTDGRWKVGARRHVIYARRDLSLRDQLAAAQRFVEGAK